jgi:glycosyltransferase involved in cell wall biosynthesis
MLQLDVSVVIAVKNERFYVQSAIESVLNQEGVEHEIIVVDDGSTDETFPIIYSLTCKHPRLQVLRNPKSGKCSAFNFGVSIASGRFVCIFAGDDIMPAKSLYRRWSAVKDMPDHVPIVGLCKILTMSEFKRFDGHLIPRAKGRGAISGVSPMMNQAALKKIFPVPEILPNEDTWMEIAILHLPEFKIVHTDTIGCLWRVHAGNSINMRVGFADYNKRITPRMRAFNLFFEKYGSELGRKSKRQLQNKINLENWRLSGNIARIILSPVGLVEKLRALSITNKFMYEIRRQLYGIFSGW